MRIAVALVAASLLAAPLHAEEAPAAGRYGLTATPDGFVRLDTRTGATTHCIATEGVWHCVPVIEAVGDLAGRIDGLAAELAAVAARVDALEAASAVPAPVAAAESPAAPAGFLATALSRLLAVVRVLKYGSAEAGV